MITYGISIHWRANSQAEERKLVLSSFVGVYFCIFPINSVHVKLNFQISLDKKYDKLNLIKPENYQKLSIFQEFVSKIIVGIVDNLN